MLTKEQLMLFNEANLRLEFKVNIRGKHALIYSTGNPERQVRHKIHMNAVIFLCDQTDCMFYSMFPMN